MRKIEAGIPDCRSDPITALADGRVGESDHREMGQSERDVDFNVHRIGVDAKDGSAAETGEHGAHSRCKTHDSRRGRMDLQIDWDFWLRRQSALKKLRSAGAGMYAVSRAGRDYALRSGRSGGEPSGRSVCRDGATREDR